MSKYPTLKKTRVDNFIKDCFIKEKRPYDTKVSHLKCLHLLVTTFCEARISGEVWSNLEYCLITSSNFRNKARKGEE